MFDNQKKICQSKDRLDIEFTACYSELMPEKALKSFTVSDAYSQFAGQA